MQLELSNEVEGEDQQQGRTAVNNRRGGGRKGKGRLERRESHAYKSCLLLLINVQHSSSKTSALSFQLQPGAGNATLLPHISSRSNAENIDESDGSGAEVEEEWLDSSRLTELARQPPSRMTEAMAIEVNS
jgi:hypothetical protein